MDARKDVARRAAYEGPSRWEGSSRIKCPWTLKPRLAAWAFSVFVCKTLSISPANLVSETT
jgi:hypothetical protein